jgi:hypothetical protein
MIVFLIGFIVTMCWVGFEFWRAPLMDEQTGRILKPGKKISDIFKKKSSAGTISDLEKLGRGRSKY